jgi:hypothetical protein
VEDDDVQVPVVQEDSCVNLADKLAFSVFLVKYTEQPRDNIRDEGDEDTQNGSLPGRLLQRARLLDFPAVDPLVENVRLGDRKCSVFHHLVALVKLPGGGVH